MTKVEQLLQTIATKPLDEKRSWYSAVAAAYDRARPRYPQPIIDRAIALAQLPDDATILEIGSGPGIATMAFARRGFSMTCLEPSTAACHIAQQHCMPYPHVQILNTTFEEWQPHAELLECSQFHGILAATSFHWITPGLRCQKAASLLYPNGSLILLWNTPPQPNHDLYQELHEIYLTHAPGLAGYDATDSYAKTLHYFGEEVVNSGHFHNLVSEQVIYRTSYGVDDYLLLLSTLSPYMALKPPILQNLLAALETRLRQLVGDQLELSHLVGLQVATLLARGEAEVGNH